MNRNNSNIECKNVIEFSDLKDVELITNSHSHIIATRDRWYTSKSKAKTGRIYSTRITWFEGYDEVKEDSILINFTTSIGKFILSVFRDGRIIDNVKIGSTVKLADENPERDKKVEQFELLIKEQWDRLWKREA